MRFPELRSPEALIALVEEIGFLPFFVNRIPGFSVEECCPRELWFAEGVDGPWEWKGPAVASGCLLSFAMSFDDVVISIFVNGPKLSTLPIKVYTQLKVGVTPEINALCTIILTAVILVLVISSLLRRKRRV